MLHTVRKLYVYKNKEDVIKIIELEEKDCKSS